MRLEITQLQLEKAIKKAEPGISLYLEIMNLFPLVNVAENKNFQRKFNHFYRVRQRSAGWYKVYYLVMQEQKDKEPTFNEVLKQLYESLGRYEPSFSSKLVATIDPKLPIWDANVLNNMQIKPPYYTSKNKIPQAMATYRNIQGQYEQFLNSEEGQLIVNTFNQNVKEHAKITDLKKVDFVFWQIRDEYSR